MILILNGYRKRAVCRKHKVEAGNWSFDPNQGSCNQPFSILISSQLFIPIYKYPKHIFEYKYMLWISKFLDSKRKIPWNFFGILISFQALHKPLTVTTENTLDHNDHHPHWPISSYLVCCCCCWAWESPWQSQSWAGRQRWGRCWSSSWSWRRAASGSTCPRGASTLVFTGQFCPITVFCNIIFFEKYWKHFFLFSSFCLIYF